MITATPRLNVHSPKLPSQPRGLLGFNNDRLKLLDIETEKDLPDPLPEPLKSFLEGKETLTPLPKGHEDRAQSLKRLYEIADAIHGYLAGKGKLDLMLKIQQKDMYPHLKPTKTADMIELGHCHVGVKYNNVHDVELALNIADDLFGVTHDEFELPNPRGTT
jgi:hypothetical protein